MRTKRTIWWSVVGGVGSAAVALMACSSDSTSDAAKIASAQQASGGNGGAPASRGDNVPAGCVELTVNQPFDGNVVGKFPVPIVLPNDVEPAATSFDLYLISGRFDDCATIGTKAEVCDGDPSNGRVEQYNGPRLLVASGVQRQTNGQPTQVVATLNNRFAVDASFQATVQWCVAGQGQSTGGAGGAGVGGTGAGGAATNPDRDGDGVPDTTDACPDVAGVANADPAKNGCPAPNLCTPELQAQNRKALCDGLNQYLLSYMGYNLADPKLGFQMYGGDPRPHANSLYGASEYGTDGQPSAGLRVRNDLKAGKPLVDCSWFDTNPELASQILNRTGPYGDRDQHADRVYFNLVGPYNLQQYAEYYVPTGVNTDSRTIDFTPAVANFQPYFAGCGVDIQAWLTGYRAGLVNAFTYWVSPIVLDLDGDGIHLSSPQEGTMFDLLGRGEKVRTAWTDGKDAFLALDRNGNGLIDDAKELFGSATDGGQYDDGFQALAKIDSNGDGLIDSRDAEFDKLLVWQDRNRDGKSTPEELSSLRTVGVKALAVQPRRVDGPSSLDSQGNSIPLVSYFVRENGSRGEMADAFFQYSSSNACY